MIFSVLSKTVEMSAEYAVDTHKSFTFRQNRVTYHSVITLKAQPSSASKRYLSQLKVWGIIFHVFSLIPLNTYLWQFKLSF